MIAGLRAIKTPIFAFCLMLSAQAFSVGLYDASYENNLLKIPLIKVGDVVYEVTMIREESSELARMGCVELCFRLASAKIAKNYASSIYSFYDAASSTATIDNLWFANRVYKVTLKKFGKLNGGDYFGLVKADKKQGLPVYLTSYENKQNIYLDNPQIPYLQDVVGATKEEGQREPGGRNIAWADFTQDGSLTAITSSGFYRNVYPNDNPNKLDDSPSKLLFWKRLENGTWLDISDQLMPNDSDRRVCYSGGFFEIADFNNDGKPDVYLGCGAIDFTVNGSFPNRHDIWILLSQNDGTYKPKQLPVGQLFAHQCAAADFDRDGNVDIICVDRFVNQIPVVLWGNGQGDFQLDTKAFPVPVNAHGSDIDGIRAIPIDGVVNVLASGWASTYGYKVLHFKDNKFEIVKDLTESIKTLPSTKGQSNGALDIYYENGHFYMMTVNGIYEAFSLIKVSKDGSAALLLVERDGPASAYSIDSIKITSRHSLVSQIGSCSPREMYAQVYQRVACNWEWYIDEATAKDQETARLYRIDATKGDVIAQHELGKMFADGRGVTQNNKRAFIWLSVAAKLGKVDAISDRDRIGALLDETSLWQAKAMSLRCIESNFKDCD